MPKLRGREWVVYWNSFVIFQSFVGLFQQPLLSVCRCLKCTGDSISVDVSVSDVYELALLPGAALSVSELYTITGSKRPCSAVGIMKEKCLRPASMRMCADCKQMLRVDKFSKRQRAKV